MNEITEEIKQMYREYKLDSPLEYITGYDVRDLIYSTLESDYLLSDEKYIGEKSKQKQNL
jgi:hypothetical protein